jgi:cyclic dehypoxanthinyl futalosine synthase
VAVADRGGRLAHKLLQRRAGPAILAQILTGHPANLSSLIKLPPISSEPLALLSPAIFVSADPTKSSGNLSKKGITVKCLGLSSRKTARLSEAVIRFRVSGLFACRIGASYKDGFILGLTKQQATEMLESDDLVGIGMEAHQLRLAKNDPRVVTYQIDRNINYTNFCTEYCSFCAFYRPIGAKDGYILSLETIYQKIEEMLELGGTGVLLQGGLHPDLQIGYYENLLRSLKQRFPQVHLHCFSAPEILCIADVSEMSVREVIQRLMDAGLQSIPGGGAELLDDEIRSKIARLKCTSDDWEQVHRIAHSLGLRTTATMMFGCGEELKHRVNHLDRIRRIQEDTGGFTAFIPWIFAAENTALGKKVQETTAVDYLKTLAVSRLYLDNIDHVQSSWLTPGIKVCQVGLQFGADDVGSILIEENVVYAAGVRNRTNENELRRIISDAGFIPAQRDTLYRSYALK